MGFEDRVTSRRCLMHCRLVLFLDNLVVVIGILKECRQGLVFGSFSAFSRRFVPEAVSEGVLPRLASVVQRSFRWQAFANKSESDFQLLGFGRAVFPKGVPPGSFIQS